MSIDGEVKNGSAEWPMIHHSNNCFLIIKEVLSFRIYREWKWLFV